MMPDKINIISYTENIVSKRNDGRPPEIRKSSTTHNNSKGEIATVTTQVDSAWTVVCDGTEF
jgi:hypothetical protein